MPKVFLIAGMGADTRLYNHINIPDSFEVVPVDWIVNHETDTLTTYAQKLIYHYNIKENDIIIGTSMGGIIAIEISKKLRLSKTILISSIKTTYEAPFYFSIFRNVPVYKILGKNSLMFGKWFIDKFFKGNFKEDAWLFKDMLDKTPISFLKWAMGAVLHWDSTIVPENVFHIHGNVDLVFPVKKIKNAMIIKDGGHLMIFDKAAEINKWLKSVFKK